MGTRISAIDTSTYPLVFKTKLESQDLPERPPANGLVEIRTRARALAGMQKEALIQYGPTGTVWRVISDEGPWLNGTDLAPFPLAFFTAGLAASFMSGFLAEARSRGVEISSLSLEQDNFFMMEGSALRGTMAASAQPVQVTFSARGNASAADLKNIAESAVHNRSAAEACLRSALASGFAVRANNEEIAWPGVSATRIDALSDPVDVFERIHPSSTEQLTIIRKLSSSEETDGPAVGLKAEQKRVVHVHSKGNIREDGLKSIQVQCIQPAGSCFEILSDNSRAEGGGERAPSGLAYLSAGVAFCFMTQIGRYAQITRQKLGGYRIIQDTSFRLPRNCQPGADAVATLVCLDTAEPPDKSLQLVRMAEQTCYIHAAFRTAAGSKIKFNHL